MFSTMRRSWLLFALFALVALTTALKLESLNMDGIESYIHHGKKRQAPGTGLSSSTPTPSPTPSSTPTPSDDNSTPGPSSTPPPTSSPPPKESSEPPTSASSTPPPPSSDPASSTKPTSTRITAPVTKSTPLVSTEIVSYETVYTYISDGQTRLSTSVGQRTSLHTTGSLFSTEVPSAQDGANSSGDGLSTAKKSIIGGVVGGVGGALLLGGIAIVAWRIWGRKKHVTEDDDDLTFSTGSALGDKSSPPSSANTPFKSNLEQYHNPGGRPNAAANF